MDLVTMYGNMLNFNTFKQLRKRVKLNVLGSLVCVVTVLSINDNWV